MAPRALATADVTGASYDNVVWGGDVTQTSSVTNSISDEKKPLYLSHGWCYDYQYGSYIILDTSCLVLIVVLVQFVESEVAVVCQLFLLGKICEQLFIFSFSFYLMLRVILLSCIIYFLLISEGVNWGLKGFSSTFSHVVCLEISCTRTMYCM